MNMNVIGLPEHNVLLIGDVNFHKIANYSTRKIIGYTLRYQNSPGPSISRVTLSFLAVRNGNDAAGISAGSRRQASRPEEVVGRTGVPGVPVAVILDAVIFDDGEVVGPDSTKTFERVTTRIKAEQDIHKKLLAAKHERCRKR
jgi:hypothetical protein